MQLSNFAIVCGFVLTCTGFAGVSSFEWVPVDDQSHCDGIDCAIYGGVCSRPSGWIADDGTVYELATPVLCIMANSSTITPDLPSVLEANCLQYGFRLSTDEEEMGGEAISNWGMGSNIRWVVLCLLATLSASLLLHGATGFYVLHLRRFRPILPVTITAFRSSALEKGEYIPARQEEVDAQMDDVSDEEPQGPFAPPPSGYSTWSEFHQERCRQLQRQYGAPSSGSHSVEPMKQEKQRISLSSPL